MQWGVVGCNQTEFNAILSAIFSRLKRRTVVLPQMLSANARLRDRFSYIELNPHFFCLIRSYCGCRRPLSRHHPSAFSRKVLASYLKGFCPKESQLVSLAASIRDTCRFVFFGDEVGGREGQNAAIAFVSALPESWQIVGKWFFQRGSVTLKKWKSPHKHR